MYNLDMLENELTCNFNIESRVAKIIKYKAIGKFQRIFYGYHIKLCYSNARKCANI